jgi:HD-like signal output (HDOD) protein
MENIVNVNFSSLDQQNVHNRLWECRNEDAEVAEKLTIRHKYEGSERWYRNGH